MDMDMNSDLTEQVVTHYRAVDQERTEVLSCMDIH